jgi:hypothetical protein
MWRVERNDGNFRKENLTATGNRIVPAFHVPVFIGKHTGNRGTETRPRKKR